MVSLCNYNLANLVMGTGTRGHALKSPHMRAGKKVAFLRDLGDGGEVAYKNYHLASAVFFR